MPPQPHTDRSSSSSSAFNVSTDGDTLASKARSFFQGGRAHEYERVRTQDEEEGEVYELSDHAIDEGDTESYDRHHRKHVYLITSLIASLCLSIGFVYLVAPLLENNGEQPFNYPNTTEGFIAYDVISAMDRSVDPCDDFYKYACGSWTKQTKLKKYELRNVKSFNSVQKEVDEITKNLLESKMRVSKDPTLRKASTFYDSCMAGFAQSSSKYDFPFLKEIATHFKEAKDSMSFTKLIAELSKSMGVTGLFNVNVYPNFKKNSKENAVYLGTKAKSLLKAKGERLSVLNEIDYELYEGLKEVDNGLSKYLKYTENLLIVANKAKLIATPEYGYSRLANETLAFKMKLSKIAAESMKDVSKLDIGHQFQYRSINDMPKNLHLHDLLSHMGINEKDINSSVLIDAPMYFVSMNAIMTQLNSDDLMRSTMKASLAFDVIRLSSLLGLVGEDLYEQSIAITRLFQPKNLDDLKPTLADKWKICHGLTNAFLGDAVGKAFIKENYSSDQMGIAKSFSEQLTKTLGAELKVVEWMDSKTKKAAQEKLSAISWKVGYSSKLDSYERLSITNQSYVSNVLSSIKYLYDKEVSKLGKPVDDSEWQILPHTINAYYSPFRNEMVFPAGIIRAPFFSKDYPDAMNYGSMGSVVGHETSHAFDSNGRQFDKDGVLRNWWTKESEENYSNRTKCYKDLYSGFQIRGNYLPINGNQTLNENIADITGINIAYKTFKRLEEANNTNLSTNSVLNKEFTNDQLFFISYAQTWCTIYSRIGLMLQIARDPHSPSELRVKGPLSESDIFSEAFHCRKNSNYNPNSKCQLF